LPEAIKRFEGFFNAHRRRKKRF